MPAAGGGPGSGYPLIIPILVIYRKYYGRRIALFLLATLYAASVGAGYVVELLFGATGLIPSGRHAKVEMAHVSWNYTTILNIAFLVLAALLVVRFVRSGGLPMLKMMSCGPDVGSEHTGGSGDPHGHATLDR